MNDDYQQFNSYDRNSSASDDGYVKNMKKSRGSNEPFKLTAKKHVKADSDDENDPEKLQEIKQEVSRVMDQFNRQRIKFSNEVNQYEKFITDFSKTCIEKQTKLRSTTALDDPNISRKNKKAK